MIENLFLALNLSDAFRDFLEEKMNVFKEKSNAFRWERREKLHMTLRFYGVVNHLEIGKIKNAIELFDEMPKMVLTFNGFSFFQVKMYPSILYAKFEYNETLLNFGNTILQKTESIGDVKENKIFKPHITIARSKKKPEKEFMDYFQNYNAGTFIEEIQTMSIYKSVQYTTGTIYKEIKKYNF